MRNAITYLFMFLNAVAFTVEVTAQSDEHISIMEIAKMESSRWRGDMPKSSGSFNGENYDWRYAECRWEIDPWVRNINGDVLIRLDLLVETDQITFDLNQALSVESVTVNGESRPSEFHGEYTLVIDLGEVMPPQELEVKIVYTGEPQQSSALSFTQSFHGVDPEIYTLSEPYGARDWWPCKQTLNDKLDSVFIEITVPEGNKAGSNGKLIYETPNGDGTVSFGWKHSYPIPAYLVSIAVTNYQEFSQFVEIDGEELEILNYVYPERFDDWVGLSNATVELMILFSELFGPYPYIKEKYGHAQTSIPGGMEHATMSTMSSLNFGLNAHELAHQWFGDKITCGSWEDIWLNEGFATYLTALSYEHIGEEGEWDNWKNTTIASIVSMPDGSVVVDDTTSRDRIFDGRLSYRKGAMVLHMLRWVGGDENFYDGVRSYLNDPELAYGYAQTSDFEAHMSQSFGMDLTEFFSDWVYGEGHPIYNLNWWINDGRVFLKLLQETSHQSVSFYRMPFEVKLIGDQRDTIVKFDHQYSGEVFQVDPGFDIQAVAFDPNQWILAESNVSFDSSADLDELLLFPNPVIDVLRVSILRPTFFAEFAEIIDESGRVVDSINPSGGIRTGFEVDLGNLAPGTYRLRFVNGQSTKVATFVKV